MGATGQGPATTERATFGVDRLGALTDGVFAIVLTLLVLELKLPEARGAEPVLEVVVDNVHDGVAWVISFVALARFWVVHHSITAHLRRCDVTTLAINLAVLGAVSLVPFTASAIGNTDLGDPWAVVLFAADLAAVSLATGWLARHTAATPHLRDPGRRAERLDWHHRHHVYVLPAVTLAVALLAFVEPYLAVGLLAGEFVWVAVAGLRRRR